LEQESTDRIVRIAEAPAHRPHRVAICLREAREDAVIAQTVARPTWSLTAALHTMLLGGMVALFLGVLLADLAYSSSYEIQWKNFASWLLVGALVLGGFALLWAVVDCVRARGRDKSALLYPLVLAAAWVLGFINALVHAKDAWASMPAALILSAIIAVLAAASAGLWLLQARGQQ
jgi:uncharacterized membrane protein